jgi:hypothetical protein
MLANPERYRTLGEMTAFCEDFSLRMQQGGDDYVHARQWLDQYWTVDEYLLIKLCLEGRLDDLYAEAFEVLAPCCRRPRTPSTRGWHSPTRSA